MFEKLGIVTNIWSEEIENGTRFDELMTEFTENGFIDMEVREGEYLRKSEFGQLIQKLEKAVPEYTDEEYKTICDSIWTQPLNQNNFDINSTKHPKLFFDISHFVQKASGLTLSYAMSHPWLSYPNDLKHDLRTIINAKKIAYLLCPSRARLRLVDIETKGDIDENNAISNLQRYTSVLPDYPMIFAVENARHSAISTLKLALKGGAKLTYDETNIYRDDGTKLNSTEEFWSLVKMEDMISVHFKQKTHDGVLSVVGKGYVNFKKIKNYLQAGCYTGDLLLENKPTLNSLTDALKSREYLMQC